MAGCTFEITRPAQNIIVSDSLVKLFRHVGAEIILRAWDVIDVCLYKTWRDIQHCHTCQIRIQITFVTSRLCHAGENSHIGEMFLHKTLFISDWTDSGLVITLLCAGIRVWRWSVIWARSRPHRRYHNQLFVTEHESVTILDTVVFVVREIKTVMT